jgi:hypothetical protein
VHDDAIALAHPPRGPAANVLRVVQCHRSSPHGLTRVVQAASSAPRRHRERPTTMLAPSSTTSGRRRGDS